MKKIFYFLLLSSMFWISSCKKLLEERPKSPVVENFYNTKAEVEAGIAAIYQPVRTTVTNAVRWIAVLESQTEWGAGLTGGANWDSARKMNGISGAIMNNTAPTWESFYRGILNANLLLKYLPDNESIDDLFKDAYIAEAKFMRALIYFYLVRAWGEVPVYTEENMHNTKGIPLSTIKEVYELISLDLEFAEQNLPDKEKVLGRPSKMTAKALLSDVYLYREMYKEARDKSLEVISSGRYSLVETPRADNFYDLFGLNVESLEEVFYFKYNMNSGNGLVLATQEIETPYFGTGGYGIIFWHTEAQFYKEWSDDDLRKEFNWYESVKQTSHYLPGQSAFPVTGRVLLAPKKYSDPTGAATISTFDFPVYRLSDILLIHAESAVYADNGVTDDALEMLNMVHRRAYGFKPNQPSAIDLKKSDFSTKDQFVDRIIKERGYEFQFEGKRWFDLVRTGKVKGIMKEMINIDVSDKGLIWPLPNLELDLNEAL